MKKAIFYIKFFVILLSILFLEIGQARGQTEKWSIKTKFDDFTIQKMPAGKYVIDGQSVNGQVFEELKDFVEEQLSSLEDSSCQDLTQQADLHIVKTKGRDKQEVWVYIQDKYLKFNDKCTLLDGDGLFTLPIHRAWFVGEKSLQIPLGSLRRWEFDDSHFIEYEQQETWQAGLLKDPSIKAKKVLANESMLPNWSKILLFERALKDIKVSRRYLLSYGDGFPHFSFSTNGQTYTFYEVNRERLVWALKLPDKPYLITSSSFNWGEFNTEHLLDPRFKTLNVLRDTDQKEQARIAALENLGSYWNTSVQSLLTEIVKNENDGPYLREKVAELLIQKPTSENKQILIDVLANTTQESLREYISKRLRLFYPKGKVISKDDDSETVLEKVSVWKSLGHSSL